MDPNTSGPPSPKRSKRLPNAVEDEPMEDSIDEENSSLPTAIDQVTPVGSSLDSIMSDLSNLGLDPEFSKNRTTILDFLDELGKPKLEEEFKLQFSNLTGNVWNEMDLPTCGQQFLTAVGQAKKSFVKYQLPSIASGDIKCWDITLLASAIRISDEKQNSMSKRPAALNNVKALKDIRNEASHTPVSEFNNKKFDLLRDKSKTVLMQFGYTDVDVDKALECIQGGRPVFTSEAPKKEFCGREGVLDACKEAIKVCNAENMIEDKIVVIQGFGGMGKSQIGKCMAQRLRSDKPHYPDLSFDVVYWFDAQTEHAIKNGFENLAQNLGIKHKLSDSPELDLKDISTVYTHLSKWYNRKVLLIFDNAEQMEAANGVFGLKKYLNPDPDNRCEKPVILVTSRVPWHNWVKHSNCIKIDELTADDTRTCLLHYMGIQENHRLEWPLKTAIDSLLKITGGHPLGLSLIGSAMAKKARDVTLDRSSWVQIVEAYLDLLRAKPRAALSEEDKYEQCVRTICEYTMRQIDDGSSESIPTTLLGVVACLHPDYITLDLVQGICYVDDAKYERPDEYFSWKHLHVEIRKAINLLRDYSLIDLYTDTQALKIHRVVQKCFRDMSLKLAPTLSPLQKIRKFLRSKDQHNYKNMEDHAKFLLRLHQDTPTEPNPLDPSSIIELTSWLSKYQYDEDDKGNRLLPRISVEAMGTRVLNEDEHNALELIMQLKLSYPDWNLIENRARALVGSTCLLPEWLIEVCCEMIEDCFFNYEKRYKSSSDMKRRVAEIEKIGWILQCYKDLPETLTIRTPENVLYVLGASVLAGEKIDHEIVNRVFLEARLEDFWKVYCLVWYELAPSFKDEWLSSLLSASSFFTQSF